MKRICQSRDLVVDEGDERLGPRNRLTLSYSAPAMQNRIVGVGGRKGSGKSTLTREILVHVYRLFLFDTMGEHNWIPDQFLNIAEAHNYIFEHGTAEGAFLGSFTPEGAQKGQLERDFEQICNAVFESGNLTFAVEEIPMMTQPGYAPESFDRLIRLGRHHCVNLLYTFQRFAECPRRLTAATDVFALFSTTEPRDLDAIAERTTPEVADQVAHLEKFEFVVYDVMTGQVVTIDDQWYDAVLNGESVWSPAMGGRHGRPMVWSLDNGE